MGTFYRKSDVSLNSDEVFDTSLSDIFTDLFDGKSKSAEVFGGAEQRGYLTEFPVAHPPPFGEAHLVGLEQHIYMESLALNPPRSSSPATYKVYKLARPFGDNEGTITPDLMSGDSKDNTLTVFSGYLNVDEKTNFADDFSSTSDSFTRNISSKMWIYYDAPYMLLTDDPDSWTWGYLRKYWVDIHPTTGQEVIWMRKMSMNERRVFKWNSALWNWGDQPTIWVPLNASGYNAATPHWYDSDIKNFLVWKRQESSITEIETEVTEADSLFHTIRRRHSGEFNEDGGKEIECGISRSAKNSLTGGTSAKFHCYWSKGVLDQHTTVSADGREDTYQRQEVVGIAPILAPSTFVYDNPSNLWSHRGDRTLNGTPNSNEDIYASEIKVTFNIENLEECSNASQDGDMENYLTDQALSRAFHIYFSQQPPRKDQSFYGFISDSSRNLNGNGLNHMAGMSIFKLNKDISSWEIGGSDERFGYLPRKPNGGKHNFGGEGSLVMFPSFSNDPDGETGKAGLKTWGDEMDAAGSNDYDFSSSLKDDVNMVLPHAFKTTAGSYCSLVPEGTWITATFRFSVARTRISLQLEETNSGEVFYRRYLYISEDAKVWGPTGTPPAHMSIWLTNYPGYNSSDNNNANGITTEFADVKNTQNVVYIDNVEYNNWNLRHNNLTSNVNNLGGRGDFRIDDKTTTDWFWNEVETTPTFLAIGFEDRDQFDIADAGVDGDGINLLFSDYTVSDANNNDAIGNTTSHRYWRAGITTNAKNHYLGNISLQDSQGSLNYSSFFNNQDTYGQSTGHTSLDTLNAIGTTKGTSGFDDTGVFKTENFTQQGVMNFSFLGSADWGGGDNAASQPIPAKRECKWASARVLEYIDNYTIVVDDPTIFNLPDDTEYILYVDRANPHRATSSDTWGDIGGYTPAATDSINFVTGLRVNDRKGNEISFTGACPMVADSYAKGFLSMPTGSNWLFKDRPKDLPRLFISPRKYWVVFQIWPINTGDDFVSPRSYKSICTVNKSGPDLVGSDLGATFNESLATDGPYAKLWSLGPGGGAFEGTTDYGFGKFDSEALTFGHVQEFTPWNSEGWQAIDLTAIVEQHSPSPGDIMTTMLYPDNSAQQHKLTVATTESTTAAHTDANTKRPYMLTKYEDSVPVISNFKLQPYSEDPMFPEFTWETDANDLWYGYFIISDTQIKNKYHRSWYSGFDVPIKNSENPFIDILASTSSWTEWYDERDGTSGDLDGNISDKVNFQQPDGLAGWAFHFDGAADYISIPKTSLNTLPTNNMSLVMHITPDSGSISSKEHLFHSGGTREIEVWLDSSYNVNVTAHPEGTAMRPVTLTSTTIVPNDGETPTCIIVTLDSTISHGNLKLFINGKLEDQSGKAVVDGGGGAWKLDKGLYGSTHGTNIYFGRNGAASSKYYDGKIEEISYYDITIYPVDPSSGSFVFDKPLSELASTSSPASSKSYSARLFAFDYHNLKGKTINEVGMSPLISFKKSAPAIDGRTL